MDTANTFSLLLNPSFHAEQLPEENLCGMELVQVVLFRYVSSF